MGLVVHDCGRCAYSPALALQEKLVASKLAGATDDYLLLLEHDPVYTLGRGANVLDLLGADQLLGIPVFRIGRGGGVTFHGPGQLVVYPILSLSRGGRDVHRYVRRLESVIIDVCRDWRISAQRRVGFTGVWVDDRKIASIGVGVRRWTTLHGLALNVSTDLRFFVHIVPCRMPDVRMTSMAAELGTAPPMDDLRTAVVEHFRSTFGYTAGVGVEGCHP